MTYLERKAFPAKVYQLLEAEGLGPEAAILFRDETPPQECCGGTFGGLLLTSHRRFVRFEIDTEDPPVVLMKSDVTSLIETAPVAKGIGTTDGFLANELLEELIPSE